MQLYGLQDTDSTEDYMLCFIKPPYIHDVPKEAVKKDAGELSAKGEELVRVNEALDKMLKEKGIKKKEFDPSTSMFRATEWLIVHMTQEFGTSMNHTAFYHYPFFDWITLYWKLLGAAFSTCASEHGVSKAFFSSGVKMNSVIGIFFSLVVALMGVLSKPLVFRNSETGYTLLQMLVSSKRPIPWKNIDSRLVPHEIPHLKTKNIYYCFVEIPPHKPFTEIILAILRWDEEDAHNVVVENVGCVTGTIGVKVAMSHPNDLNPFLDVGGSLVSTYQHPGYGKNLQWYALLGIKVPLLLIALRSLRRNRLVTVEQIYDFFHDAS